MSRANVSFVLPRQVPAPGCRFWLIYIGIGTRGERLMDNGWCAIVRSPGSQQVLQEIPAPRPGAGGDGTQWRLSVNGLRITDNGA